MMLYGTVQSLSDCTLMGFCGMLLLLPCDTAVAVAAVALVGVAGVSVVADAAAEAVTADGVVAVMGVCGGLRCLCCCCCSSLLLLLVLLLSMLSGKSSDSVICCLTMLQRGATSSSAASASSFFSCPCSASAEAAACSANCCLCCSSNISSDCFSVPVSLAGRGRLPLRLALEQLLALLLLPGLPLQLLNVRRVSNVDIEMLFVVVVVQRLVVLLLPVVASIIIDVAVADTDVPDVAASALAKFSEALQLLLMKLCRWISSNRSISDLSTTTLCDNSITFCMFECRVTCKGKRGKGQRDRVSRELQRVSAAGRD